MKKLLFILPIIVLLAVGCNGQQAGSSHIYREPNSEEINKFIPYGYQLHKIADYQSNGYLIKANFDKDIDKEIVLLMDSGSSFDTNNNPPKLMLIKYNHQNDTWELLKNIDFPDYAQMGGSLKVTDLDNDGIDEIHFSVSISGADGYTTTLTQVITIKNNNLINLFPEKETYNDSGYYDDQSQTYILASFIWGQNEGHFGCHNYQIKKYKYQNGQFQLISTYTTKGKYSNDFGVIACPAFNIYSSNIN